MYDKNEMRVPEEVILRKIFLVRGVKVMLDMDLAELYGVENKQLKRAVRRNLSRFPIDFMFEFTIEELNNWRSQFGTSNREKMGMRIAPFAFTENGIMMIKYCLSSNTSASSSYPGNSRMTRPTGSGSDSKLKGIDWETG